MANFVFNEAAKSMIAGASGEIDYAVDTIKAMLVTSGYTPNKDHVFINEGAVANRVPGTTDQTLGSKAIGVDTTGDFGYIDAADPVFTAVAGGSAVAKVVIYKSTGTDATSKMICTLDVSVTTNGGDITISFAAPASGGIAKNAT